MSAAPDIERSLANALQRLAGLHGHIDALRRRAGGATKTTWSFDLLTAGEWRPMILQQTPPGRPQQAPRRQSSMRSKTRAW